MRRTLSAALLAQLPMLGALLASCAGSIGDSGQESGARSGGVQTGSGRSASGPSAGATTSAVGGPGGPAGDNGGGQAAPQCLQGSAPSPGPSPLRRLTRFEYNNTVRDLLGDTTRPADEFVADELVHGVDNNADYQTVSALLAEQYFNAAERLAGQAMARLPSLLGCDPVRDGEEACGRSFVASFGKRAFRRPLTPSETTLHQGLFSSMRTAGGFAGAIATVIHAMLYAPQFLYRVETPATAPTGSKAVPLTGYQIASRLSYLFWATMPDDQLFAAAEGGKLATAAGVAEQTRRLIADPRARAVVAHVHEELFGLSEIERIEKDTKAVPAFRTTLRPLMRAETSMFLDHVFWDAGGGLAALLTAPYSFMNAELAALYGGASPAPTGTTFQKVMQDPSKRAGLLTQAGILAVHANPNQTNPVTRGKLIREMFFCQSPSPPPPDIMVTLPALKAGLTTRERFSQHATDPACAGCHRLLDPIGLGFEHYDALGQWRNQEQGKPIDPSGEIVASDVDGPFAGAPDLASKLARSRQVSQCFARSYFRVAQGREATAADGCTLTKLEDAFAGSGYKFPALLAALATTDAFLYRSPIGGVP